MEDKFAAYKTPSYAVEKIDFINYVVTLISNSEMRQDVECISVNNNHFKITFTNGQIYSVMFDRDV